jgi:hypothetical protein
MSKNTVKRTIQVSGHSFKLHFCMFEKSQGKHKIWIIIKVIGIFSLFAKFKCSKVDTKMFLHVQSIQILKVDNPYFFQMSFF